MSKISYNNPFTKEQHNHLVDIIVNAFISMERRNISKSEQVEQRFKLPPADVSWEGKKTYLRNFIEFPKALRREPE